MSAAQIRPMILAIGSQNTFLHVYNDERELLADDDIGAGVGESRFPIEFFDSDGYRLAGVYDGHWHLVRLMPTAEEAHPDAVLRRVWQVTEHLRAFIKAHPEEVELFGMTVQEALEFFPAPEESQDLKTALLVFSSGEAHRSHAALSGLGEHDAGSMRHNAAHIFGNPH